MDSKSDLRIKAKNIRKNLNIGSISSEICSRIRNLPIYQQSKNVMIYYPMKYEISLLDLLIDDKNFYLPKVFGEDIFVCPYSQNLRKSDLNIYEPCTKPVDANILDLVFVPALMVDSQNYRLGYGGGFYDRFLDKYSGICTITPIVKELCVKNLPHEKCDIRVDYIISEK